MKILNEGFKWKKEIVIEFIPQFSPPDRILVLQEKKMDIGKIKKKTDDYLKKKSISF